MRLTSSASWPRASARSKADPSATEGRKDDAESIRRHKRLIGAVVVVVAIPALALAWWLLSPLLFDKEVQEEFPFAASATVPADMERADVEKTMAVFAKMDDAPTDEPMPEMANDGSAGTAVVVKAGEFTERRQLP